MRRLVKVLTASGFHVIEAANGRQALHLLEHLNREIDLAVVDEALPDMMGFEVAGHLTRQNGRATKVLAREGLPLSKPLPSVSVNEEQYFDALRNLLSRVSQASG